MVVLGAVGRRLEYPVLVAPMSQQRIVHDEGELAVARAVAAEGICMVMLPAFLWEAALPDMRHARCMPCTSMTSHKSAW